MFTAPILALAFGAASAMAAHNVNVNNQCGQKFTMQIPNGDYAGIYSGGGSFNGDINGVIASVGDGCDINGVPCVAAEFSLNSGISSADITRISPHAWNGVSVTIEMAGQTKTCASADCADAFPVDGNDAAFQIQDSNNPNSEITMTFTC